MKIKRWGEGAISYFYARFPVSFFLSDSTFYMKKEEQELNLEILPPTTKNLEAIRIREGEKVKSILK